MATQSLYRRYRPRRFAELKGQDHVVRALRDAVAGGREGQAYLFSGPRGTGKTTSARILAKVLNCERPVDGEPCCECDSCLAVERGTSYDVHELDAASNNGVDAMRDLIERASLGTPGRHKVYILDEVHMLSKAAEAALLKTLEEPPPHVVFVLATTDPQKVSDTIRSRTQHLRFHLLSTDTLAEHVRWVAEDAGLTLDDAAIDEAIAQGAGSARDTLSALELIANAGGDAGTALSFDEFVEAMIDHDPGRALTAMAHAVANGNDPRAVAEQLVRHLRNGFLALMAPELVQLSHHQVDELAAQAQRLGSGGAGARHRAPRRDPRRAAPRARSAGAGRGRARAADRPSRRRPPTTWSRSPPASPSSSRPPALGPAVAPRPRRRRATPPPGGPSSAGGPAGPRRRAPTPPAGTARPEPVPTAADPRARRRSPPRRPRRRRPPSPRPVATSRPSGSSSVRPTLKGIVRALFTPVDVLAGTRRHRHDGRAEHDPPRQVRPAPRRRRAGVGRRHRPPGAGRAHGRRRRRPTTPARRRAAGAGRARRGASTSTSSSTRPPGSAPSALDRLAEAFPGAELVERSER